MSMSMPMTIAAMMTVPAHPLGKFVTGQNTVLIGVHAGEHADKSGAVFVR